MAQYVRPVEHVSSPYAKQIRETIAKNEKIIRETFHIHAVSYEHSHMSRLMVDGGLVFNAEQKFKFDQIYMKWNSKEGESDYPALHESYSRKAQAFVEAVSAHNY